MSTFNGIVTAVRQWRLWPLAVVLVAALIGVPVLLTKKAGNVPVAQLPSAGLPVSGAAVPSITVDNTPAVAHLAGKGRDPFAQQRTRIPAAKSVTASTVASTAVAASASTASSSTGSTSTAGSTGSTSTTGSSPSPAPAPAPKPAPKPATSGLTATQSYDVSIGLADGSGGFGSQTYPRLTVFPSAKQPMLIELGALQGAQQVLFEVQPGIVLSGPGTCTPGPLDCEILSLAQNQTETVSMGSASTPIAVTGIQVHQWASAAAANAARAKVSAAGEALYKTSALPALSLFPYDQSLGVVVDQRNLTVGG
jgi:hypothetical protein